MAPPWIFKDKGGKEVSARELRKRMKEHIYKIAGRYRGRIAYWDVVNEAVKLRTVKDENGNRVEKAFLENLLGTQLWRALLGGCV